eukprot:UN09590
MNVIRSSYDSHLRLSNFCSKKGKKTCNVHKGQKNPCFLNFLRFKKIKSCFVSFSKLAKN